MRIVGHQVWPSTALNRYNAYAGLYWGIQRNR